MKKLSYCPFCEKIHDAKYRTSMGGCIIAWNAGCREMVSNMKNSDGFLRGIKFEQDFNKMFDKYVGKNHG